LLYDNDICLMCSVHVPPVDDDSSIADLNWSYVLGCDDQFAILYMVSMEQYVSYELNLNYVKELLLVFCNNEDYFLRWQFRSYRHLAKIYLFLALLLTVCAVLIVPIEYQVHISFLQLPLYKLCYLNVYT
jgi:hypothetical protein